MVSGQDQLTRLEYEKELKSYQNDHELLIHMGLEIYDVKVNCARICPDPGTSRKQKAFNYTSIAAFIVALLAAFYDYVSRR